MGQPQHLVFISYAAEDKAVAESVCVAIESAGVQCWIAPRNIVGGNYAKAIMDAITACKLMLLIFSKHTGPSPHVCREIERSVHRGIPIMPLRLEDIMPQDDLEYFLSNQHWADLFPGPVEKHVRDLPGRVCSLLGVEPRPAAPAPAKPQRDPWGLDSEIIPRPATRVGRVTEPAPPASPRVDREVATARKNDYGRAGLIAAIILVLLGVGAYAAYTRGWLARLTTPRFTAVSPPSKPSPIQVLRTAFIEETVNADEFKLGQRLLAADLSRLSNFDVSRRKTFENFASGGISVVQLKDQLAQVESRERDNAAMQEVEKQTAQVRSKINQNLSIARVADTAGKAKSAMPLIDEVLQLDPSNSDGKRLREQLRALLIPKKIVNSSGMTLVLIAAGDFVMGSPPRESGRQVTETQHQVRLTKPFYLGDREITQGQWKAIVGTTIEAQRDKEGTMQPLKGDGASYPMYYVSWDEAIDFCEKLSAKESRRYRLPTEAEWEYACRAGSATSYCSGDSLDSIGDVAWFEGNSASVLSVPTYADITKHDGAHLLVAECHAHPVGVGKPNAWGLFDMHGNVWEWCSDYFAPYPLANATDPSGPVKGLHRVLRGGSYRHPTAECRSAHRSDESPVYRSYSVGFRVALEVD